MVSGEAMLPQYRVAKYLLLLMLIALSAMSYVPSPSQPSLYVFLATFSIFSVYAFVFSNWWKKVEISKFAWVMVLSFIVVINIIIALYKDVAISKWARSFVPLAFFITLLWFPFYIRVLGVRKIWIYFLLSCVAYCLFLVLFNYDRFLEYFHGGGRLTFYLQDSVVPYPFLGIIIASCLPGLSVLIRSALVFFFLIFVVAVGYKLQLLFLVGFFLFSSFHYPGILRRVFLCFGMAIAFLCVWMIAGDYIEQRLSSIGGGGDEVRFLEIKYAISVFVDNPVFGGGLGLDVPLDQTRPAYSELKDLWESDSVSYIHNFPFYLLMVGGISFFFPFVLLLIYSGVLHYGNYASRNGYVKTAVWAILGLLTFFTTSAAHKQIQCIIAVSLFLCVYRTLKSKVDHV